MRICYIFRTRFFRNYPMSKNSAFDILKFPLFFSLSTEVQVQVQHSVAFGTRQQNTAQTTLYQIPYSKSQVPDICLHIIYISRTFFVRTNRFGKNKQGQHCSKYTQKLQKQILDEKSKPNDSDRNMCAYAIYFAHVFFPNPSSVQKNRVSTFSNFHLFFH